MHPRAGDRDPVVLSGAELGHRAAEQGCDVEFELSEQPGRFLLEARRGPHCGAVPRCGKPARQRNVFGDGEVGYQVEHLEDEADTVGAECVPLRGAQLIKRRAKHLNRAGLGNCAPAQQAQKCRLATAAWPLDQQPLTCANREVRDIEDSLGTRFPAEGDIGQFDGGVGHQAR